MKNFILSVMLLATMVVWAQAPEKMSYQAVIRDASDVLVTNTTVGMKISILKTTAVGTPVYEEIQTATTNANGLVSLEVGAGTVLSGDFSTIGWGTDAYFIKTETDPTGGTSYSISGTSQLLSVPYALYAKSGGGGNTLDQAYNQEMTTTPTARTIFADDGKIEILASDNLGLEISGDPDFSSLLVTGMGDANVLRVESAGAGDGIFVDNTLAPFGGAGDAISVTQVGVGDGIYVIHNVGGGDAIHAVQDGIGDGVYIDNTGAGDGLRVDQTGPGDALFLQNLGVGGGNMIEVIQAGAADAVVINNAAGGGGKALLVDQAGVGIGIDLNVAVGATGNGLDIDNDGAGKALLINNEDNAGGADAIDIANDGGGDALTIDNAGAGDALFIDNTDSTGGIAVSVNNDGGGIAIDLLNDGGGIAFAVDNTGGGNAILVTQDGAANAVDIMNDGTGFGLGIANSDPAGTGEAVKIFQAAPKTALFVDNAGTGKSLHIINGNPINGAPAQKIEQIGSGTALLVENAGPGKAAHFINGVPGNPSEVLLATTAGIGNVGMFITEDNNTNFESTIIANNNGGGSAGEFFITDELTSKANDSPVINVVSNGMGEGVAIELGNLEVGLDSNVEAALRVRHKGYGEGAFLETDNGFNTAATLEIKNNGSGHGAHIDSYDNPGVDVESTLYVEQGNLSSVSTLGRTAVFDLHPATTAADAAVLIRSGATSGGHSALRVIAADPTKLAAVFSGDVEITSDLLVGGSFTAAAKSFKIDHPLDPENKFLIHNSIESDERINMYSGNIVTNSEGLATVILPEYMCVLNKDFKYQLTIIDKSFAQAIIWETINTETNSFVIKTDSPEIMVSWQITGTRQDKWALENPLTVEMVKPKGP
ncbi:hypothetical protein K8089_01400 [Aequorivita sp. F47161]|uniref:Uncharacterized protein n=1 Tax=Aequorivita vitellina TaxID=2874475 RepID=A0A9X1QW17_9FLAO|nr:hypothetical protein [Aequorivita vitellina]MCG2417659.1 hypothetical protein [Aequorivita vitellina]